MDRLTSVAGPDDIFPEYRDTPVGRLLEYHNLDRPLDPYSRAELLVGMCMDNRKRLRMPDSFAYVLRAGGANLRPVEFQVSFALTVGGVRAIALIGHTQCGMTNLVANKARIVQGLVEEMGWRPAAAEDHFNHFAPIFEIGNELDFVISEARRLRMRYPGILVAPMLYRVEDHRLYQIRGE